MLRWLIRNRQKAGIGKRYGDAQRARPPATAEPPTPPPASGPASPSPTAAGGDLR
jgi:hypothetical protein